MVYVLTDAVNKSVIGICDDLDNAKQWKDNAVEVGEHRGVNIQSMEISTDKILPLSVIPITSNLSYKYTPLGTIASLLGIIVVLNSMP